MQKEFCLGCIAETHFIYSWQQFSNFHIGMLRGVICKRASGTCCSQMFMGRGFEAGKTEWRLRDTWMLSATEFWSLLSLYYSAWEPGSLCGFDRSPSDLFPSTHFSSISSYVCFFLSALYLHSCPLFPFNTNSVSSSGLHWSQSNRDLLQGRRVQWTAIKPELWHNIQG